MLFRDIQCICYATQIYARHMLYIQRCIYYATYSYSKHILQGQHIQRYDRHMSFRVMLGIYFAIQSYFGHILCHLELCWAYAVPFKEMLDRSSFLASLSIEHQQSNKSKHTQYIHASLSVRKDDFTRDCNCFLSGTEHIYLGSLQELNISIWFPCRN